MYVLFDGRWVVGLSWKSLFWLLGFVCVFVVIVLVVSM